MRKKRLRGTTHDAVGEPRQDEAAPRRHTARVRRRLTASVALVSVAVLGAGAPAVLLALDDTTDAQHLVDLAETNRGAVTLAHALADERDAMTRYVADGRTTASGGGISEDMRARVDRRIREVRPDVPAPVRQLLDALPELRQHALTGKDSALDVFTSYTRTVQALNGIADTLARRALGTGADTGTTAALAPLGRAVEEASATRGLLLAALDAGGGQDAMVSAAQRTNLREQSALADFEQLAPASARDAYDRTVNGTEVTTAERYLARLTDQSRLSDNDVLLGEDRVESALSARIDRMRGAQSALASAEAAQLARVRDDAVTDLEVRAAIVGAALLVALGAGVHSARSMTRPLAALRLGARRVAADPAAEEPVVFKGRDDEFADAVRAVNELHAKAARAAARITELDTERTRLVGERQRLAAQRDELRAERDAVATRLEGLRARVHGSFVSLALRSLGLIERQLAIIESLEEREQDPDRLETLFELDHLATGMRRYGENLLVIAGSEQKATHPGPVPLLDVLRASISEVERYDRVQIQALPPHAQVAGYAADSVSHLIAELLENATSFSPPDAPVQVSGWLLETGEVMLSVQDEGIGMTPERFIELNDRLADPVPEYCQGPQPEDPLGLGLYVVTRLAARHGIRVQLREQQPGGVAAVVVLPTNILPAGPPGAGLPPAPPVGAGATFSGTGLSSFPGTEAEANSNTLPGQPRVSTQPPAAEGAPNPEAGTDADPSAERAAPTKPAIPAIPAGRPAPAEPAVTAMSDGEPGQAPQTPEPGLVPESGLAPETGLVPESGLAPEAELGSEPELGSESLAPESGLAPEPGPAPEVGLAPEAGHGPGPASAEAASGPESAAPWAVSGERWGRPADAVGDYPMEPTPPRGHPNPGNGGALPALPKRVPKPLRTTGQDDARHGADDPAPARAPEAEEPEVPAVERTMELTLHRENGENGENRESLDDRESYGDREDGDDRESRERRFGAHGVRPVGADAWGPADTGPAQADPARDDLAERGGAMSPDGLAEWGGLAERDDLAEQGGLVARGGSASRDALAEHRGPVSRDGVAERGGPVARDTLAERGGLAAREGLAERSGLAEQGGLAAREGLAERSGLAEQGGLAARGGPVSRDGVAERRGPVAEDGLAERGGLAAQDGLAARDGLAERNGLAARDGLTERGALAERGGAVARDGVAERLAARDALAQRGGLTEREGLAARDGLAERGGLAEQGGLAARGGPVSRDGVAERRGPVAEDGVAERGGPVAEDGLAERGGPASQGGLAARRGPVAGHGLAERRGPVAGHGLAERGGVAAAADPYAIGPDQHARPEDEAPPRTDRTDKGLPKRTPRSLSLRESDPEPRERTGSVSAEELRHRLGGFQRGAREGRRDAAAEIAARGEAARRYGGPAEQTGARNEGGTVEEARG
ncbi:nitrate- and nitrite sensing domain-containing protein [Streptomyces luomodiensis]|uniref:histidine kinase n=1 Tax=Streptomyces luomodiensis TaxID=3026192 RepID=A0ABY9V264_9ACTN|nr:nitrate- and nitrite sensing domain-containing protein [Streptomyces sp. SCA4-21]WNE98843.1 nitrate- and nitrite sensing domain-containing protein [Streptomyces sp. SCA4-21]